ncbi:MAG: hypothetical protein ABGX25_02405, partial [Nautiliaceae bacterium]
MNRIEEYLQSLDNKNRLMLYVAILLLGGFIYYYVNYNIFYQKIVSLENKKRDIILKMKKQTNTVTTELVKLKKKYKKLLKQHTILKGDLKYLIVVVNTSKKIFIDDKKFFYILNKILENSNKYQINSTYLINTKKKELKDFNVILNGSVDVNEFLNLANFIRSVEKMNFVKSVNYVNL